MKIPFFSILFLAFILVAPMFCASCNRSTAQAHPKKFYWIQAVRGHPVHRVTQAGFKEECRNLGYECEVVGPDSSDVAETTGLAEQVLARGDAAGMAVWGIDEGMHKLIEKIAKKGIPVVIPHFPTDHNQVPDATGVISGDPAAYGRDCAMALGKQIDGKGTVAITQANYNLTENMLSKSFTEAMHENFPNVKVMTPQLEGLDSVQAVAKASAILEANPDIVAALSTTGNVPPTWPGAEKQTGRHVISITMNYTRQNLDAIRDGKMYGAVAQPLWEESQECARLLDKAVKGEKVEWWTKMPAPLITKENVDQYYKLMDKIDAAMK